MRALLAATILLGSAVPALAPARAQDFTPVQRDAIVGILRDALKRDPTILREALAALQTDDGRRQAQASQEVIARLGPKLMDAADPVAGNPLGDVTIVEFYDTRCPYCRTMEPVIAELLRRDGRIRLVVKDMPILGPNSLIESRALLAAQGQGGYFKLRPAVLALSGTTTRDTLRDLADRQGLDGARLLRDMDDPAIKARLDATLGLAPQLGIDGTPAFVIGSRMVSGAADLREMQAAVAAARGR